MSAAEDNTRQILEELGFTVKKNSDRNESDQTNTIYSQFISPKLPKVRLDFALLSAKIAIEVHGDYWHATDRSQKKLTTAQIDARLRDEYKRKLLADNDWKLIVIYEKDVMNSKQKSKSYLESSIFDLISV